MKWPVGILFQLFNLDVRLGQFPRGELRNSTLVLRFRYYVSFNVVYKMIIFLTIFAYLAHELIKQVRMRERRRWRRQHNNRSWSQCWDHSLHCVSTTYNGAGVKRQKKIRLFFWKTTKKYSCSKNSRFFLPFTPGNIVTTRV